MYKSTEQQSPERLRQAVLLAGGRGTRLRPLTDRLPKPMVPANGKPFLHYLIKQLEREGFQEVLLLTGYLGAIIQDYFKDGSAYGLKIKYSNGPVEWQTARRLKQAEELLDDRFFLLYSDNIICFHLGEILQLHNSLGRSITLSTAAKDPGNIELSSEGLVLNYDNSRSAERLDYVEVGYMLVEKLAVLKMISRKDNHSFSKILTSLAAEGQLAAWKLRDCYHSISDLERLNLTEEYLRRKKIVLLDRDGTICRKAPRGKYITTAEEFEFLDGAISGLRKLSQKGYSFLIITNQAGLATGDLTVENLEKINEKMLAGLRAENITVSHIYTCGDHWQDHESFNRKPAPGMFFQASRDFQLKLDETYYIGDDTRDLMAAYNACCRAIFIGTESELSGLNSQYKPDYVCRTLAGAADFLLDNK